MPMITSIWYRLKCDGPANGDGWCGATMGPAEDMQALLARAVRSGWVVENPADTLLLRAWCPRHEHHLRPAGRSKRRRWGRALPVTGA